MTDTHPLQQRIATVIHDDLTSHKGRLDGGLLGIVPRLAAAVLDELQPELDQLDALRAVARGYCPACGRGDAAPTVTDWEQQKQRADRAEAQVRLLRAEIASCKAQQWPQQLATAEATIIRVRELRDDLRGITGARWIADMLDTILDGEQP